MTSVIPKNAMASATKLDAVRELGQAEGEANGAGIHVGADEAEQHADAHHARWP